MLEMKWLFCIASGEVQVFSPLAWSTFVAPSLVTEDIAAFWAERKCAIDTPHASRSRVITLYAARALAAGGSVAFCHLGKCLVLLSKKQQCIQ
jgi:hypothetical protein